MKFLTKNSNCLLVTLVAVHLVLLTFGATRISPTYNEPAHLVAGVSHLEFGRFDLYRVNPPIVRLIAGCPVVALGYDMKWAGFQNAPGTRPVFRLGEVLVESNGSRYISIQVLARFACIPLSICGALGCFFWAAKMAGNRAGLCAVVLWCSSPTVIGNGQLITTDAHASGFGALACYAFWKWLQEPTWANVFLSGIVLGVAELSKTTLIVFYPIWPVIWVFYRYCNDELVLRNTWLNEFPMLIVRMLIGVYIINLGYGFEEPLKPLGEFEFVSKLFGGESENEVGNRFSETALAKLPVPLPKNYVLGIDIQQRDFEDFGRPSYLRGRFQEKGWWYYYLYVIAVKTPIGTLILVCTCVTCTGAIKKGHFRDLFVLAVIPLVIFAVVSSKTGFSHHGRYILPCYPFVFILISVLLFSSPLGWLKKRIVAIGITWTVASMMMVYPHSLSYFNEFTGGPIGGPNHLLNSNIDWGQDLLYLKRWMDDNPEKRPVGLAYYGYFGPEHIGLEGTTEITNESDIIAISVNLFHGYPWNARDGSQSPSYRVEPLPFDPDEYEISHVGYSMLLLERK